MIVTRVEDCEVLYRAVRADCNEYRIEEDGTLRFTVNAFNDSGNKPSVDRSSMRPDPRDTRLNASDGVTAVVTSDVRNIGPVSVEAPDGKVSYAVDVQHRPLAKSETQPKENIAHCQIECDPEIKRSHFKKIKEALAILATKRGWTVEPTARGQSF